jgi:hypothetical protein
VQQHLHDVCLGQTVIESAPDIEIEFHFMQTVERRYNCEIDDASHPSFKSQTASNLSPALLGEEFL